MIQATTKQSHKSLKSLDKIQLVFDYHESQNKINLSFYHSIDNIFCNESHLFIHSLPQIISHFSTTTQSILLNLQKHYDDTFYYSNTWFNYDSYSSYAIVQLIQNSTLINKHLNPIKISQTPVELMITCKITNNQILISFIWIAKNTNEQFNAHDAMQCERSNHIIYHDKCYKIDNNIHAKIAMQFHNHNFQRLDIAKIKPFISKLVDLRKKSGIKLAIDKNIQALKEVQVSPTCIISIKFHTTNAELFIQYKYNNFLINISNPTPYIIFKDYTFCNRDDELEHKFRDILLHYHPISTHENSLIIAPPYLDQLIGEIIAKQHDNISLCPETKKAITSSKTSIKPTVVFKSTTNNQVIPNIQWIGNNNEKLNKKINAHIHLGFTNYFNTANKTLYSIDNISLLKPLTSHENLKIPIGIAIF